MIYSFPCLALLLLHVLEFTVSNSLNEDPSTWPGHLQPLGTGRPITKVAEVQGFPEPNDFFQNYVHTKPKKAVIFKGGAKLSPAFDLWSDEYLKGHPDSEEMEFDVEVGKKETRQGSMERRNIKNFIETYHNDDIYAVTDVPDKLKSHFLLPPVLRCNNIKDKLSMMLMWFSSGGTKSVLHQDSFENINCLFRGKKRLLIAEYPRFKKQVVIDRPNGYTAVDVDKVDFVKYPGLREVEYVEANMEEGDCLYIPYQWFHQVTSYANENQTNMALNVWWYKNNSYFPQDCHMTPQEATLDKFEFKDQNEKKADDNGDGEQDQSEERDYWGIVQEYFKVKNVGEIPYETFVEDIEKSGGALSEIGVHEIPFEQRRKKFAKLFYNALDLNKDGKLDFRDFDFNVEDEDDGSDEDMKEKMDSIIAFRKVTRLLDRYFEWLEGKKAEGELKKDNKDEKPEADKAKSSSQSVKEEL